MTQNLETLPFRNLETLDKSIKFEIRDVDLSIVSGVRRTIIADVECVVFEFDPKRSTMDSSGVVLKSNTSVLNNEFLGDRLSLIPPHFDENETREIKEGRRKYVFEIRVKNEDATRSIDVTTGDITGIVTIGSEERSMTREELDHVFPRDTITGDHILLNVLKPLRTLEVDDAESIHVLLRPSISYGREHARGVPGLASYGNIVDEIAAKEALRIEMERLKSAGSCTEKELDDIEHDFHHLGRLQCFLKNDYGEPNAFKFYLRSDNGLRPTFIFFKALSVLISKLKSFKDNVSKAKKTDVNEMQEVTLDVISTMDGQEFTFTIFKESHTLGNLLQSQLFNSKIRAERLLKYVGYYKPHPVDDHVILRVIPLSTMRNEEVIKQVVDAIEPLIRELNLLTRNWIEFSSLSSDIQEVQEFSRLEN